MRLTEESLTVLQAGMESAVSRHFNDGGRCMLHASRKTMFPCDLRLAASVRSDDGLFWGWRPQGPATPAEARMLGYRDV